MARNCKPINTGGGFFCSESLCNSTPEFEFEKEVWVEEIDGKLIIKGECRVCQSQFGQFENLELPQEFIAFARFYFFGKNPNIFEETPPEIPVGFENRFQLSLFRP